MHITEIFLQGMDLFRTAVLEKNQPIPRKTIMNNKTVKKLDPKEVLKLLTALRRAVKAVR